MQKKLYKENGSIACYNVWFMLEIGFQLSSTWMWFTGSILLFLLFLRNICYILLDI